VQNANRGDGSREAISAVYDEMGRRKELQDATGTNSDAGYPMRTEALSSKASQHAGQKCF